MRMFALKRSSELDDMLSLPNGVPSTDTFERTSRDTQVQHPAGKGLPDGGHARFLEESFHHRKDRIHT